MRIVIQILVLDGVPIAGLISGSFAGPPDKGLYALHIVFDAALRSAAPGSAVLLMGMRHAIVGRYAFFNLLSGFGYYKTRWLAEMTPTRCVQIYRIGGPCFWRRLLGDARRWVAARARLRSARITAGGTEIEEQDQPPRDRATAPLVTAAERADFAALIAEARQGDCDWLANEQLAAAMPFSVDRPAVDRPAGADRQPKTYAAISARPAAAT